jgi:hypothetical protein
MRHLIPTFAIAMATIAFSSCATRGVDSDTHWCGTSAKGGIDPAYYPFVPPGADLPVDWEPIPPGSFPPSSLRKGDPSGPINAIDSLLRDIENGDVPAQK